MTFPETVERTVPPLLQPISNEVASSSYLAELVPELPYAASQFGIVLTTALEYRENPENVSCKRPSEPSESESSQPHYRSKPLPAGKVDGEEQVSWTELDLTISNQSITFYARCEPALVRAAALEANRDGASGSIENNSLFIANEATADNMPKALESGSAIVQAHSRNVISVMSGILEHQSAERIRLGKNESSDDLYCVHDIWLNQLSAIGDIKLYNRAIKFVISEDDLVKEEPWIRARCEELERDQGLVVGPMVESDIKQMLELNTVRYPEDYGKHIIKRSVCFRDKDQKMVAWAGTHGDSLHVLPEYRKAGLGRLVLNILALMHVRLAREILTTLGNKDNADIPASQLVAHADCLVDNIPTLIFMERCGWRRVGFYLWLNLTYKSSKDSKNDE
ncbi:hypothetical protein BGX31_003650 [Mortierella sp. GBA43]|nr:hypothetical protein BGX31_003650 [Mortierella sp. GBA43]